MNKEDKFKKVFRTTTNLIQVLEHFHETTSETFRNRAKTNYKTSADDVLDYLHWYVSNVIDLCEFEQQRFNKQSSKGSE